MARSVVFCQKNVIRGRVGRCQVCCAETQVLNNEMAANVCIAGAIGSNIKPALTIGRRQSDDVDPKSIPFGIVGGDKYTFIGRGDAAKGGAVSVDFADDVAVSRGIYGDVGGKLAVGAAAGAGPAKGWSVGLAEEANCGGDISSKEKCDTAILHTIMRAIVVLSSYAKKD